MVSSVYVNLPAHPSAAVEDPQVDDRTRCNPSAVIENSGHRCEAGAHSTVGEQSVMEIIKDKVILLLFNTEASVTTVY